MDGIKELLGSIGVDINLGLVVLIIIASSKIIGVLKSRNKGVKKGLNYRTIVPFIVGMVIVLAHSGLTQEVIVKADIWKAVMHSIMATGLFSTVKSFLKEKGLKL